MLVVNAVLRLNPNFASFTKLEEKMCSSSIVPLTGPEVLSVCPFKNCPELASGTLLKALSMFARAKAVVRSEKR